MKAKKLPSGRWRCQAYLGTVEGKKKFKSFTADTKKEAEFLAAQYLHDQERYASSDCLVADAIDRYISSRESVLSPATFREYRRSQKRDYAALDGYSESHVDPAINVTVNFPGSRSDGECIAIPLDREEQGLLFGILDRECRKLYGKTAMEIIDEAVNEEFDETARGWE